jgi:hypothetical protein
VGVVNWSGPVVQPHHAALARKHPMRPIGIATANGIAKRSPVLRVIPALRFNHFTEKVPPSSPPTMVLPASR